MVYNDKDMGWFSADLKDEIMSRLRNEFKKKLPFWDEYHFETSKVPEQILAYIEWLEKELTEARKAENLPISDVSKRHDWKIILHQRTKSLMGGTRDEYKLVDGEGEIRYIGTHSMCVWKLEEGVC